MNSARRKELSMTSQVAKSSDHSLNQRLHSRLVIDNEFWLRTNIVISRIGALVLLTNLFLYFWTIRYLYFYD